MRTLNIMMRGNISSSSVARQRPVEMLTGGESLRRQGSNRLRVSTEANELSKRAGTASGKRSRAAELGVGAGSSGAHPQPRRSSHIDRMRARESPPTA